MLSNFAAERDWVLEPGDMLYLPPGVAHHGIALDPCLTYSIGFRAPGTADLAMALGEWLAQRDDNGGRYTDPPLQAWPVAGEISPGEQHRFREQVASSLNDESQFADFLAGFLSRYRQAHEPTAGPTPISREKISLALNGEIALQRHPWARAAWVRQPDDQALLYVSGQAHKCSPLLAESICAPGTLKIAPPLTNQDRKVMTALLSSGQILIQN